MRFAILIGVVTACAGSQPSNLAPKSWSAHMTSAEQHEHAAAGHEQAAVEAGKRAGSPTAYQCGDTVLNDQVTTGGERVTNWMPCWDLEEEAAMSHRDAADRERAAAKLDRTQAALLARAEALHCKGIPARELEHSPFAHKKALAQVIPHRRSGEVHGARIIFKPIPGLTADYVRHAIGCHQARFAVLGNPPTYLPEDPTLVEGADVTVTQRRGHVEVFIRTDSDVAGAVAFARAQDLLRARTANRD